MRYINRLFTYLLTYLLTYLHDKYVEDDYFDCDLRSYTFY